MPLNGAVAASRDQTALEADALLGDVAVEHFDALVLPGGPAAKTLREELARRRPSSELRQRTSSWRRRARVWLEAGDWRRSWARAMLAEELPPAKKLTVLHERAGR